MCIKICICVANPFTNIKKIPALQDKYIIFIQNKQWISSNENLAHSLI